MSGGKIMIQHNLPSFAESINVFVNKDGVCDWAPLAPYRKSIASIVDFFEGYIQSDKINRFSNCVKLSHPSFWKELEQVASFSKVSPESLLTVNVLYDILSSVCSCTAFAVNTDYGPLHCHCLDWELGKEILERNTILIHFLSESGKPLFSSVGWPGFLGVYYGIAQNKFAITLNAVWSTEKQKCFYPLSLFLRNIFLKMLDFKAAVKIIENTDLSCDCILLITGDVPGEILIVERTPSQFSTRSFDNEPVIATNHFIGLPFGLNEPGYVETGIEPFGVGSFNRYKEVVELFSKTPPRREKDCLRYMGEVPFVNDLTIHRTLFHAHSGNLQISSVNNLDKWILTTPKEVKAH